MFYPYNFFLLVISYKYLIYWVDHPGSTRVEPNFFAVIRLVDFRNCWCCYYSDSLTPFHHYTCKMQVRKISPFNFCNETMLPSNSTKHTGGKTYLPLCHIQTPYTPLVIFIQTGKEAKLIGNTPPVQDIGIVKVVINSTLDGSLIRTTILSQFHAQN